MEKNSNFKKVFVFISVVVIVCLIFTISFIYLSNYKKNKISDETSENLQPLKCDLNIQKCVKIINKQDIEFNIEPKPIYPLQNQKITIKNINTPLKKPKIVFYGLNMYMGEIVASLIKQDDKYTANFILSSCFLKTMRYRAQILDEGNETDIYIDFDVRS